MQQHTKLRQSYGWPLVSVLVLAWLWTGCSSQPGGAASSVVGSIGTVLQNPMTQSPDCWACVLEWCQGVPVPCNHLIMIQCDSDMISVLCPGGYPGAGNTTRQGLMNWISTNSGGQVPAGVTTAVNNLCMEAARQVALRGGIC